MGEAKFTQGSIICSIRSEKYPGTRCYGIIISARCDIAQTKVEKIYLLTAVDAKEWIGTNVGIHTVYKNEINGFANRLRSSLSPFQLSFDVLGTLSSEEADIILRETIQDPKSYRIIKNLFDEYSALQSGEPEKRRQYVNSHSGTFSKFLKDISKGTINHYFFLPQSKYLMNNKNDEGLIVDLQDIFFIPFQDLQTIQSPGIDILNLNRVDVEERKRQKSIYYLEDESDYVAIEGTINSPWCELLIQRFSNDFIRIGVDGASEDDYKKLAGSV